MDILLLWVGGLSFLGVLTAAHYAQVCARELKGIRELMDRPRE